MGFLENTDVQTILKDKTLVNELSEDAAKASEVMSELAGDVASELGDQLEDAAKAPEVMSELAEDVADELGDQLQKDVGLPTAEYTQAW